MFLSMNNSKHMSKTGTVSKLLSLFINKDHALSRDQNALNDPQNT